MPLSTIFQLYHGGSLLSLEETGVPGEYYLLPLEGVTGVCPFSLAFHILRFCSEITEPNLIKHDWNGLVSNIYLTILPMMATCSYFYNLKRA
jgi:hypothetical protein